MMVPAEGAAAGLGVSRDRAQGSLGMADVW